MSDHKDELERIRTYIMWLWISQAALMVTVFCMLIAMSMD